MYFDGWLKLGGVGTGIVFISPDRKQLKYVVQILWQATNNEAKYEALINGLRIATSLRIKRLLFYGDLAIVINQLKKDWDCTKENVDAYCVEVRKLEKGTEKRRTTQTTQSLGRALYSLKNNPPKNLWVNDERWRTREELVAHQLATKILRIKILYPPSLRKNPKRWSGTGG